MNNSISCAWSASLACDRSSASPSISSRTPRPDPSPRRSQSLITTPPTQALGRLTQSDQQRTNSGHVNAREPGGTSPAGSGHILDIKLEKFARK